jgi:NAD+ kinase
MRFSVLTSPTAHAQSAEQALVALYGPYLCAPQQADVLVALGGDGFLLECLHQYLPLNKPIFGLNLGTVGFLMNPYRPEGLLQRLSAARHVSLSPLRLMAVGLDGSRKQALAFNEVTLTRSTRQAARLKIWVDGIERLPELSADGVLLATPAGSTAYNSSVFGPIVPLGSNVLALTPISAFRPRRWRGALLPHSAVVKVEVLDPEHRRCAATADFTEMKDIAWIEASQDTTTTAQMLFDPEEALEERIIKEQFLGHL